MKCPSCGYENREDARYCNLCQTSFIKAEPEPPGLAPPPLLKRETVPEGEAGDLSWFQRHLNWTWVLPQLFLFLFGIVYLETSSSHLYRAIWRSSESEFVSTAASLTIFWYVWTVMMWAAEFGIGAWVLKKKKRSLWWLAIFFIPTPITLLLAEWSVWPSLIAYVLVVVVFLFLDDASQSRRVLVSYPTRPDLDAQNPTRPGLDTRGLKSQSENEKYWW